CLTSDPSFSPLRCTGTVPAASRPRRQGTHASQEDVHKEQRLRCGAFVFTRGCQLGNHARRHKSSANRGTLACVHVHETHVLNVPVWMELSTERIEQNANFGN